MEDLIGKIEKFLNTTIDGDSGSGHGSGNGYGYGYSNGDGYGDGDGRGDGDGYGRGDGSGSGSGNGDGSGRGDGLILKLSGKHVYRIDGLMTVFERITGNYARISILREDMTLQPGWLCKRRNYFAHGNSLREAKASLEAKLLQDMPIADRVSLFKSNFAPDEKYLAHKYFDWHFKLTGSCEMGRKEWVKSKGIDLNNDQFTPLEFCEMVKEEYGSYVIEELIEEYR